MSLNRGLLIGLLSATPLLLLASPPGVPDGTIGQPVRVEKLDPAGSSLKVTWDSTTCPGATHHQIVFGLGGQLPNALGGTYGLIGATCAIGPTSPYLWDDSPDPVRAGDVERLLWFLVLATDGLGTEGSWGIDSAGGERNGPGLNGSGSSDQCGMLNKSLANVCGNGVCDVDIRTIVDDADDDPPEIQANYDGLNRSKHLYGRIPFEHLLGSSLDGLAPVFLSQLDTLQSCTGLPTNKPAIAAAYMEMADNAGGLTVGQIIALPPGSLPGLQASIDQLRSLGIGFPEPATTNAEAFARAAAISQLMADAGTLRYRDLYFLNENDVTPVQLLAVKTGKSSGAILLSVCHNDRCCAKGAGPEDTDLCNTLDGKDCYRPRPSGVYCSIASDKCP